MITYKPLSELPVKTVSELWNDAFEGYASNVSMTLDRFIDRVANEGLSLERSFACYADEAPAGIVMNGFRDAGGVKTAWNGGTAVMPAFRGSGIGKALMERNLALYQEEGVKRATLEAIGGNERAIRLYEGQGYAVVDRLQLLTCDGDRLPAIASEDAADPAYIISRGPAAMAAAIPWYRPGDVWQAGLPSLRNGECAVVSKGNEAVGYGLIRRSYDAAGNVAGIVLYRLETAPGAGDKEAILRAALRDIWQPELACKRTAFNIPASDGLLLSLLGRIGFAEKLEQVLMAKDME